MKKALVSKYLSLAGFGVAVVGVSLMMPCKAAAASDEVITFAGRRVSSIYEGLQPSSYSQESAAEPRDRVRLWQDRLMYDPLGEQWSFRRHRRPRYLPACTFCDSGSCFGHFEIVVPCYGCCTNPSGCGQINNYQTNTTKGVYNDQVIDDPCGPDCCDAFFGC